MRDTRLLETVLLVGMACAAVPVAAQQPKVTAGAGMATRADDGPMPAFEPPMLDLIFAPEAARPSALRVAVKTERFRAAGGWTVPVILSVDPADLAPAPAAADAPADAVDFEVDALALVSDAGGRIVAKLSRSARVRAPKRDVAAAERVALTFDPMRRPLAPGGYVLHVCVYDPTSRRATVIRRTFTLPDLAPPSAPSLSSLVLARYVETSAPGAAPDPFVVDGSTRVVPSASGRFSKSRGDRLIVFYRLYGMPGVQYQAQIRFVLGDKPVRATAVETLPAIGPAGEVAIAPVVPLDGFAPGVYRATVQIFAPGSTTPVANSLTSFVLEP